MQRAILLATVAAAALAACIPGDLARAQGTASTAVTFLLISPNARSSALGESGTASCDDVSSVFWNPAGLGFQSGQEMSLSYANWLPQFHQADLFYSYANYKIGLKSIGGTLGASLTYLNLGQFERRGEGNEYLGTFSSYEGALSVAYGTRLDEDMSVGLGLRVIHSSLSQVATGREQGTGVATVVAGDIGFLYRPSKFSIPFTDTDIGDHFAIGAAITNMGPSVSYIDVAQADPLPTALRIGVDYDIVKTEYNRLSWTADITKLLVSRSGGTNAADPFFKALFKSWDVPKVVNTFTLGTGIEYWYSDFVALRFGFFHEDPNQGNRRFLTFGAGLRYEIYGFDFSYISTDISSEPSPLADTIRFTLSILWDRSQAPPDDGTRIPADDSAN